MGSDDFIEFKVEGLKELMDSFDAFLDPKEQVKLVQSAVTEAMKPVKVEAERRLGKGKGYIVTRTPSRRKWSPGTIASKALGLVAKHWPLVFREYGTIERFTKKGAKRGKIVKHPFARPALDSQRGEAVNRMRKFLDLALTAFFEHRKKSLPEPPKDED